jgi:hypothetical protein
MRRGDPERIYQAQRAGIFARLTPSERVDELDAEHWITRWERHAEAEGLSRSLVGFWDTGWLCIAEQRATKTDMNAEGDDGQVYGGEQDREGALVMPGPRRGPPRLGLQVVLPIPRAPLATSVGR